ncbi:AAA family ATPase [Parashewanella curva]|uniref:AAA family ATPase n=1 Tax=Parashewanella curva TaxID=2338552 RepID=A0A3L8PUG2_9GAMM|nr:AAA family ATPase [Parashewanella curva]RLV58233.1 AAA family ATPase [Parashewanella curva]
MVIKRECPKSDSIIQAERLLDNNVTHPNEVRIKRSWSFSEGITPSVVVDFQQLKQNVHTSQVNPQPFLLPIKTLALIQASPQIIPRCIDNSTALCSFMNMEDFAQMALFSKSLLVLINGNAHKVVPHSNVPRGEIVVNPSIETSDNTVKVTKLHEKYPVFSEALVAIKLSQSVNERFMPICWNEVSAISQCISQALAGVPVQQGQSYKIKVPYNVNRYRDSGNKVAPRHEQLLLDIEFEVTPIYKADKNKGTFRKIVVADTQKLSLLLVPTSETDFKYSHPQSHSANALVSKIAVKASLPDNYLKLNHKDYARLLSLSEQKREQGSILVSLTDAKGCESYVYAAHDENVQEPTMAIAPTTDIKDARFNITPVTKSLSYSTAIELELKWHPDFTNQAALKNVKIDELVKKQLPIVPMYEGKEFVVCLSDNDVAHMGVVTVKVLNVENDSGEKQSLYNPDKAKCEVALYCSQLHENKRVETAVQVKKIRYQPVENEIWANPRHKLLSIISVEDMLLLERTGNTKSPSSKIRTQNVYINNTLVQVVSHPGLHHGQIIINPDYAHVLNQPTLILKPFTDNETPVGSARIHIRLENDQECESLLPLKYNEHSPMITAITQALHTLPIHEGLVYHLDVIYDANVLVEKDREVPLQQRFRTLRVVFTASPLFPPEKLALVNPPILEIDEQVPQKTEKKHAKEKDVKDAEGNKALLVRNPILDAPNLITPLHYTFTGKEFSVVLKPEVKNQFEYCLTQWEPSEPILNKSVIANNALRHNYLAMEKSNFDTLFMGHQPEVRQQGLVVISLGSGQRRYYFARATGEIDIIRDYLYLCNAITEERHYPYDVVASSHPLPMAESVDIVFTWHDIHRHAHQHSKEHIESLIKEQLTTVVLEVGKEFYTWLDVDDEWKSCIIVGEVKSITGTGDTTKEPAYAYTTRTKLNIIFEDTTIISGKHIPPCSVEKAKARLCKGLVGVEDIAISLIDGMIMPFGTAAMNNFILLHGLPGNGKSSIAYNALIGAGINPVEIQSIGGSELLGSDPEATKKNLEEFFKELCHDNEIKKLKDKSNRTFSRPRRGYIINELDLLLGKEGKKGRSNEQAAAYGWFLQQFQPGSQGGKEYFSLNVVVIATSNCELSAFSKSLKRNGRMGLQLKMSNPNENQCAEIIKQKTEENKEKFELKVDSKQLANVTKLMCSKGACAKDVVFYMDKAFQLAKQHAQEKDSSATAPFSVEERDLIDALFSPEKIKQNQEKLAKEYQEELPPYRMSDAEEKVLSQIKKMCETITMVRGRNGIIVVDKSEAIRMEQFLRNLVEGASGFYHYERLEEGASDLSVIMTLSETTEQVKSLLIIEDLESLLVSKPNEKAVIVSGIEESLRQKSKNIIFVVFVNKYSLRFWKDAQFTKPPIAKYQIEHELSHDEQEEYIQEHYPCTINTQRQLLRTLEGHKSRQLTHEGIHQFAVPIQDKGKETYTWDFKGLKEYLKECEMLTSKVSMTNGIYT